MIKWIRNRKWNPIAMATGGITGGLLAFNLRYGIAFCVLTGTLWLSYMYGYHRGETEMHDRIFPMIREKILIPLKNMVDDLACARALNREIEKDSNIVAF